MYGENASVRCISRAQIRSVYSVRVADVGLAVFTDVGLPSDMDPYLFPTMMISLRAFMAADDLLQLPVLGLQ